MEASGIAGADSGNIQGLQQTANSSRQILELSQELDQADQEQENKLQGIENNAENQTPGQQEENKGNIIDTFG